MTEEAKDILSQAHMQMLTDYRRTRSALFRFLTVVDGAEEKLRSRAQWRASQFEAAERVQFDALVEQGCTLLAEAAAQAKAIVQWQATMPLVDAYVVQQDGTAGETFSLPLLPISSGKTEEHLSATLDAIALWYEQIDTFLRKQGL